MCFALYNMEDCVPNKHKHNDFYNKNVSNKQQNDINTVSTEGSCHGESMEKLSVENRACVTFKKIDNF